MAVTLDHVETGTATISNGNQSATATLSTTLSDTSKAFLVFQIEPSANRPDEGQVIGEITNTTTITFATDQKVSADVTIRWFLSEFSAGVTVQHGSETISQGTSKPYDITIPSVDTGKAFPIITYYLETGGTWSADDWISAEITSSTNLRLNTNHSDFSTTEVRWQVVEYDDCSVQSGTVTFGTGDTSETATITSVDTDKAWLILSTESDSGTGSNIGQKLVTGKITNATTLTFERENSGQAMDVVWYLVEFTGSEAVQSGSAAFGTTDTTVNETITAVDTSKVIATAAGLFNRTGRSSYSGDDDPTVASATMEFTSTTNLRLVRDAHFSTAATVEWFVVEFDAVAAAQDVDLSLSRTAAVSPSALADTGAGLSLDKFTGLVDGSDAQAEGALQTNYSLSQQSQAVTQAEAVATLAKQLGISESSQAVAESILQLGKSLAQAQSGQASSEASLSLQASKAIALLADSVADGSISLDLSKAITLTGILAFEVDLSLAKTLQITLAAIASGEGDVALGLQKALSQEGLADTGGALDLSLAQAIQSSGEAVGDSDVSLPRSAGLSLLGETASESSLSLSKILQLALAGTASSPQSVSLAKTLGFNVSASALALSIVDLSRTASVTFVGETEEAVDVSLTLSRVGSLSTSADAVAEAALAVDMLRSLLLDAQSSAEATLSLGHNFTISLEGTLPGIEAAVTLSRSASISQSGQAAASVSMTFNLAKGIAAFAQAQTESALALAMQRAVSLVGVATVGADVSLTITKFVVVSSVQFAVDIEVVAERLLLVFFENRTHDVLYENRTLNVKE